MNCKGELRLHDSLSLLQDVPGKLTFAPQEAFRKCWSCFWPVIWICGQAGRESWCPEQPKKEDKEASCTWWLLAPQRGTSTTVDPMGILGTAAYIPENLQVNLVENSHAGHFTLINDHKPQTSMSPWSCPADNMVTSKSILSPVRLQDCVTLPLSSWNLQHFLSFPTCCLFHWGYRKIKRDHQATIPSHLWASALHNTVKVNIKMWCVCQICTVSEISTNLSKGSAPYQLTDGDTFPLVGLRHCSWKQSACNTK